MNITVYLGANKGNDDKLSKAVVELGKWIGKNNNTLIYGGSKTGLMGELAQSVLSNNGKVIGVEVELFVKDNLEFEGLTKLYVTKDKSTRRHKKDNHELIFYDMI